MSCFCAFFFPYILIINLKILYFHSESFYFSCFFIASISLHALKEWISQRRWQQFKIGGAHGGKIVRWAAREPDHFFFGACVHAVNKSHPCIINSVFAVYNKFIHLHMQTRERITQAYTLHLSTILCLAARVWYYMHIIILGGCCSPIKIIGRAIAPPPPPLPPPLGMYIIICL